MTPSIDRFCGFIVGQCLGDAMGFLVEGDAPHVCRQFAHEVVLSGRLPRMKRGDYSFGQYSDESQMAREMMESYVACNGFDPEDYARRITSLFSEERIVGRGHATEEAAERLAAGISWREAGTPPPAAGNASAMRAGILGLLHGDTPDEMIRIAVEQGLITHADPRCSAGAVAMAGAVALAARDAPVDPRYFLEPLRRWTVQVEPQLSSALHRLEELLLVPWEQAAEDISRLGLPPGVDSQWRGGISAFVISSVVWALYAFLKHPDDWREAVALAIAAGGDVDTTAAMAGALVGARKGMAALPLDLAGHLNDHGGWKLDDLKNLAQACHETRIRAYQ